MANITGTSANDFIDQNDGVTNESDSISGLTGDDILFGLGGDDFIFGEDDDDGLFGGLGNDSLNGGVGIDLLDGNIGDDILKGGAGADKLFGGEGVDTAEYGGSAVGVTVNLTTGTGSGGDAAGDTLAGIENLKGSGEADTLIGNSLDNVLDAGLGFGDVLQGGGGNDTYLIYSGDFIITEEADAGTDEIYAFFVGPDSITMPENVERLVIDSLDNSAIKATGTEDGDFIRGNTGPNEIKGLAGDDTLKGDLGNDTLTGGLGKDSLGGGDGRDVFDFNSIKDSLKSSSRDVIQDFKRGTDDIDLVGIDAKKGVSGNQKFKFIGKHDFSDTKGELRYEDKGSKVIVQGDVNGDGKADFEILVKIGALSAGDFLL